jgi:hypothetical protein
MLPREYCIALLAAYDDFADGSPIDEAHNAIVETLGWGAFSDEALSLMATELLRLTGRAVVDPADTTLITLQRRH